MKTTSSLLLSSLIFGNVPPHLLKEDKYLKEHNLTSYDDLDINMRIYMKGLISGNKAIRAQWPHRMDWREFDILNLIKLLSDWKQAINCFLYKLQFIDNQ